MLLFERFRLGAPAMQTLALLALIAVVLTLLAIAMVNS
jgi:hypothetical protein